MATSEVIGLLEAYLETARSHPFSHIAIAMTGHPNIGAVDYAGDIALELSTKEALEKLIDKIDRSVANRTPPAADRCLDASHFCYNIANDPLGYDYLNWLVNAEMTRVRHAAPAPLKVGFWQGIAEGQASRRRRKWLDNLFRPGLQLLGAVESDAAIRSPHTAAFISRETIVAARQGERVPRFKNVRARRNSVPPVTITLREASHQPQRNSNMKEWLLFARWLRARGETVIFVRDFEKSREPLLSFRTAPGASEELLQRYALYESAKCNLFVPNGPALLSIYGSRPWLQFVRLEQDGPISFQPRTPEDFWQELLGLSRGDQYPWSSSTQRLVWAPDTFDNMKAAWLEHEALMVSAAA